MTKPKSKIAKSPKVESVEEPTMEVNDTGEEHLYMVRLDSKRFESRTLEQAVLLIKGSEGVVSKYTLERQ